MILGRPVSVLDTGAVLPSFQIRYIGPRAPEPETLVADDAAEAVLSASRRLTETGSLRAVILFGAAVIQTLYADRKVSSDIEGADQRFASAGIYVWPRASCEP